MRALSLAEEMAARGAVESGERKVVGAGRLGGGCGAACPRLGSVATACATGPIGGRGLAVLAASEGHARSAPRGRPGVRGRASIVSRDEITGVIGLAALRCEVEELPVEDRTALPAGGRAPGAAGRTRALRQWVVLWFPP